NPNWTKTSEHLLKGYFPVLTITVTRSSLDTHWLRPPSSRACVAIHITLTQLVKPLIATRVKIAEQSCSYRRPSWSCGGSPRWARDVAIGYRRDRAEDCSSW